MAQQAELPFYSAPPDLQSFYGLSRRIVGEYRKRGLIPQPTARCRFGDLWREDDLIHHRTTPQRDLAAAVPIDDEIGKIELSTHNVYACPASSGRHLGWTAPSVVGLVSAGRAEWRRVLEVARYRSNRPQDPYEKTEGMSAAGLRRAAHTASFRFRDRNDHDLAIYILGDQPLGEGPILVSGAAAVTTGLQGRRLLRVDPKANRVGAPGNWLPLRGGVLPTFVLPVLDEAWPTSGRAVRGGLVTIPDE